MSSMNEYVKQNINKCFTNNSLSIIILLQERLVMNMTQKMVNFRMDEDLKNQMEDVCREMGISLSTAFTMFAKKVTKERRIPFEITADPFYSEDNINELKRRIANLEAGKTSLKEHELIEVD